MEEFGAQTWAVGCGRNATSGTNTNQGGVWKGEANSERTIEGWTTLGAATHKEAEMIAAWFGKESELLVPIGKSALGSVRECGGMTMRGWIGVDLDGTLAKSVKAQTEEEIGAPIRAMVQLVKWWLAHGEDVRIFTARVNPNHHQGDIVHARRAIEAWCKRHLGQILPVTYEEGLGHGDVARRPSVSG